MAELNNNVLSSLVDEPNSNLFPSLMDVPNNNLLPSPVDEPNSSSELPPPVKKTKGRRRVEIKKVQAASNRHVTFSKRKKGLFNKAAELSLLTGAETAAVVVSGNGRMFGFSSSSCDAVMHRYLAENNLQVAVEPDHGNQNSAVNSANLAKLRQQLLEAKRQLEEEKKLALTIQHRKRSTGVAEPAKFWLEEELVDQTPRELESYAEALQRLKLDVEKKINSKSSMQLYVANGWQGCHGEIYMNNNSTNMNNM